MAESQEEKVKKILASKGVKIKDVIEKLFPQGRGSYYNEVRKVPLPEDFILSVQKAFNVDLVKELFDYGKEEAGFSKEDLAKELIETNRKYQALLEKGNADKDKIIELLERVASLEKRITGT
jgi:hypothetical protein